MAEEKARLAEKRVLMVIAHRDFRDEEYQEPRRLLESRGARVTVASSSLGEAKGMLGARAKPDILLKDARASDYDAVVFVGGSGATEYWDDPTAHSLAKDAVEKGRLLAAICLAPATLARAGLLRGKRATVFSSAAAELRAGGANYTAKPVEVDGRIITADGPSSARSFAEAVSRALSQGSSPQS